MKPDTIKLIGKWLLCFGIAMLVIGIVLTFSIGTALAPVLMTGSIVINTLAVMLIRSHKGEEQGKKKK